MANRKLKTIPEIEEYLVSKDTFSDDDLVDNIAGPGTQGIKTNKDCPAVILTCSLSLPDAKRKYPDGWDEDKTVFYYHGMKSSNPEDNRSQGRNESVNQTLENKKKIYVLSKVKDKHYRLLGRFKLQSRGMETPEGIVFPLVLEATVDDIKKSVSDGDNGSDKDFFDYLERKGIFIRREVVENFLISVKAKPFVILSGSTGNGKTALAKAYGEFMRDRFDGDYKLVAVGSNWTESRFILGYVNPIFNRFVRTPSYDIIETANENPDRPYVLILDEMNLSRVEYYFSDLLSAMESGEPIEVDEGGEYPVQLRFTDNLVVIGTVNMDETTNVFSPKVLDRANVIAFPNADVARYLSAQAASNPSPKKNVKRLQNPSEDIDVRGMTATEVIGQLPKGLQEPLMEALTSLQDALVEIGFPMGYRTLNEILRFLYVSWMYEGQSDEWNWKRYLDSQVMQKVLPRIHGNTSIAPGLAHLQEVCRDIGDESADRVQAMVETLGRNRHVSFNL